MPGVDLLGTAAVNAQMVMEIAAIYGINLTRSRAQELAISVGRTLATLGVVKGGKNMMGQKLIIPMEKKNINVTVSDPVFLDKENKRLNA